ncbi:lanthionine synthetase C family protein [Streptomyces sp. NPDC014733]|uniref:lanthionine synthetase C family protein n=1 Tax=Streptomyces sp. NPDC014733 TaxID=3364885 RepID=UPI003701894B
MTPTGPAGHGDRDPVALRTAATEAVGEVAERLADPRKVADTADFWIPQALSDGHSGMALFFAELAHQDPAHRATAHAHLAACVAALPGRPGDGLYHGAPALAFAAHTARRAPDDYAGLLARLDPAVDGAVRALLQQDRARLAERRAGLPFSVYDLIGGLAGLTRLLLARRPADDPTLTGAVAHLLRILEPLPRDGTLVPGWWSPGGTDGRADENFPDGHLNFGVAHGITGVLSVLVTAHRAQVPAPGLGDGIHHIAELLLARRTEDGRWPSLLPLADFTAGRGGPPGRSAWCYGTPGVAAVLHRAGEALDRPDWRQAAVDAALLDLADPSGVGDAGICHGWAGLLYLATVLGHASGDARFTALQDRFAARTLDFADPARPFVFGGDPAKKTGGANCAGLLTGAAGTTLALHAYATGAPSAGGWDAALLLS